ncbi:choloylglycine hydrolase family protein [Lentilactobacillus kosonis]|uniref:Penicillin V acylase related amidase n=1 Tax=Lentilactobacillus kosonis TaxID=2810561 RepID=A0A401FIN5_9LACO|nr:choloylglycine hydrolase family protein [Lentilactobacillus kosonis]GAY72121.1 penicillin V acylase related amidase [Lentilactobacillus kosonis]
MCTSIFQIGQKDGTHVLARTMDWPRLGAKPVAVPRHFHWQSVFDNHEFISRYAVLGSGGQHDHEIDISDGVNEYGLAVQKLTFTNGSELTVEPTDDKVHLAPFELSYYLLSTFKSVAEIIDHIEQIELMADKYSLKKYGHSELHFAASDPTGRIVVIEPVTHPIEVIDNPLGVVTNSNHFQRQLDRLGDYVEFTDDFNNHTVPLNTARVTTGNASGKMTPPGSYTPGSRFIRAAYLKERIDLPDDEAGAVDNCWHLLDSVNVPKSSEHQPTYSVYRAAVCCESRTLYYQTYSEKQIIKIKLTDEMITAESPRFFEIDDRINFTEIK